MSLTVCSGTPLEAWSAVGVRVKAKFEVSAAAGDEKAAGVLTVKEVGESEAVAAGSPRVLKKIAAGAAVKTKD